MRSLRLRGFLAAMAALAALLGACSGGGPTGDPETVVRQALQLVAQGQFEDLPDLACADKRDEISADLGLTQTLPEALPPGLDPTAFASAFTLGTDGLTVTSTDRTTDRATVHVKGRLDVAVDEERLATLIRNTGLVVDETLLDQIIDGLAGQLGEGIPVDEDLTVVSEGGAWKIC